MSDTVNKSSQTHDLPYVSKQGQNIIPPDLPSKRKNHLFHFQNIDENESNMYENCPNEQDTQQSGNSTQETYLSLEIPPIYLYDISNYDEFYEWIANSISDYYSISHDDDSVKLILSSVQDYRSLILSFETHKIRYLTFNYPIEDPLSLVIHNIPIHVSEDMIYNELISLQYDIVSVTRLGNQYFYPIPSVSVLLAKPAIKICSINRLLNYDVLIEPRKPFVVTPPPCTNSQ